MAVTEFPVMRAQAEISLCVAGSSAFNTIVAPAGKFRIALPS